MSWTAEQQAMLKAMGLRVWAPPLPPEPGPSLSAEAVVSAPSPLAAATAAAPAPAAATALAPALAPAPAPPPAQPRLAPSLPASQSGWPALHAAVRGCRACTLCEGRQQAILGQGPVRADWLIVADPPDEQEDREGALFLGPAGRLLDNMLSALGLGREGGADAAAPQVYLTSALKCRAPRNRNPSAEELAHCAGHLQQQIALLQPKVILSMGRFANWQLLGQDQPLGPLRGKVHQAHGVPVVVTFHPQFLLRHQSDKPRAWDDLCRAAAVVRS